jgi:hypothetical protein
LDMEWVFGEVRSDPGCWSVGGDYMHLSTCDPA